MICSLCLKEIEEGQNAVEVDGRERHETCSEELERMICDLEKINADTCPQDI